MTRGCFPSVCLPRLAHDLCHGDYTNINISYFLYSNIFIKRSDISVLSLAQLIYVNLVKPNIEKNGHIFLNVSEC